MSSQHMKQHFSRQPAQKKKGEKKIEKGQTPSVKNSSPSAIFFIPSSSSAPNNSKNTHTHTHGPVLGQTEWGKEEGPT